MSKQLSELPRVAITQREKWDPARLSCFYSFLRLRNKPHAFITIQKPQLTWFWGSMCAVPWHQCVILSHKCCEGSWLLSQGPHMYFCSSLYTISALFPSSDSGNLFIHSNCLQPFGQISAICCSKHCSHDHLHISWAVEVCGFLLVIYFKAIRSITRKHKLHYNFTQTNSFVVITEINNM